MAKSILERKCEQRAIRLRVRAQQKEVYRMFSGDLRDGVLGDHLQSRSGDAHISRVDLSLVELEEDPSHDDLVESGWNI